MFSASPKIVSYLQLIFIAMAIIGVFLFEVNTFNLTLILLGYFLYSGLGVSMTMHRYYSHRSFEFKYKIFKYICTWFAIVSGRGSPLGWVYVHRIHHKYADSFNDPHNSNTVGWRIFLPHMLDYGSKITNKRIILDMFTKKHLFVNTYYLWFIILWSLFLLLISLEVFYFFYVIPFTLSFVALNLFVLLAHKYGYRNHDTMDNSRNNWFISLILWGEGWHNNHHADAKNFTTKVKKYEYDPMALLIKLVRK